MNFRPQMLFTIVASLLIAPAGVAAQRADSAPALLRAAIDTEVVDGDLPGAIKRYQAIVDRFSRSDRATVVQALMRMAEAHQKLGSADAGRIYAQIVRDYAEHKQAVATARVKLAAAGSPEGARISKPVCTGCVGPFFHSFTLSPDGRWLGYTDANNQLMSRNVVTGETKHLVSFPPETHPSRRFRARRATWSPDLRQVAYFFRDVDAPGDVKDRGQLRVMGADPTSHPRTLVDNPDFIYVFPTAWSPDSQAILVMIQRRDFTWQLAWVSVRTGAVSVLRSLEWQFNEFRNGPELSPDGRYIVYSTFNAPRKSPGPNEGPISADGGPGRSIHVLAADGSRDVILPAAASGLTSPVWTPDGARVLFLSDRDGAGTYDLWAIEVRDGNPSGLPVLVKAAIGTNIGLVGTTRSGLLYYVQPESSSRRIVVSDLGAVGTTKVTGTTTGVTGFNAAWSPDGTSLAWLGGIGGMVVRSLDTGREQDYALPPGRISAGPFWASDGTAVLVGIRNKETASGFGVARIDLQTSEARTLGTYLPPGDQSWDGRFTLGPNDQTILVRANRTGSSDRSVVAVDLISGKATPVLSGVTGVLRLQQLARPTVGQAREVLPEAVEGLGVAPLSKGKTVAVTLMNPAGNAYVATMNLDASNYRELYGPVPGRPWNNSFASRLSDPKWLHDELGVAFGIQQEDLSWKLLRVTPDARSEPLGFNGSDFTLDSGTLRFDISPDGRRVAQERLMTFTDELWALDLTSLVKTAK